MIYLRLKFLEIWWRKGSSRGWQTRDEVQANMSEGYKTFTCKSEQEGRRNFSACLRRDIGNTNYELYVNYSSWIALKQRAQRRRNKYDLGWLKKERGREG